MMMREFRIFTALSSPKLLCVRPPSFYRLFAPGFSWSRSEVNELLVGFGQQVCFAINPSCSTCGISEMCPSAERKGNLSSPP